MNTNYKKLTLSSNTSNISNEWNQREGISHCLFIIIIYILGLILIATPGKSQNVIWYEDFDENSDGVTMYAGAVGWNRDLQGASIPGYFEVRNHEYKAHFVNSEVLWISELINIKYLQNVCIYVDLASDGVLESTDSVNVYYRVDNGPLIQLQDANQHGNFSTVIATSSNISGSKLQIIAHFSNNAICKIYTMDNVFITAEDIVMPDNLVWYETFDLADGTFIDNGSSAWSRNVSGTSIGSLGCFDVRLYRLLARDLNGEAVWISEAIDISGHKSVDIFADIYSYGLMDNSDYIKIFYKLDGGAETLLTNGEIDSAASDIVTAYANGLSGSTVQFVARVRNNSEDEHHMLDNILVKVSNTDLQVTATGGKITCADSTVTLNATVLISGVTYSWLGPDGFTSTMQNPAVVDTGVYTLTVTNPANGSTAMDTAKVTLDTTLPGALATVSDTLTCTTTSVMLSGSSVTPRVSYSWSGPGGFSSNEQNPSVNVSGIYTLTVTDPDNGCTSSQSVEVIGSGQIDASASISGALTCTDTIVTLFGNSSVPGVTYSWSVCCCDTLSQNIEVNMPGVYSLTVIDTSNGCYSVVSVDVTKDITPPGVSTGVSGQLSCTNPMVTLLGNSSTSNVTYSWSGPGGFSSNEQNPTANTVGTYTLTVTNPVNGCTGTSSVEVTATSPGPGSTFWLEDFSLPDGTTLDNGSTSWSLQNTGTGTFSVQDNEFMVSFDSANEGIWLSEIIDISTISDIDLSLDIRSATASSSDYFEPDDYIKIYYKLDDGDEILIFEDFTGLDTTTNTPQHFTVCAGYFNASTIQIIVKARNSSPTERYYIDNVELKGSGQIMSTITTSVSGLITCQDQNVQLSALIADSTATYYWIDPDSITIDQQNPVVNKAGDYTVVVSVGECQASKTVTVAQDILLPGAIATVKETIKCILSSVLLSARSPTTGTTYRWTGPEGYTSTQQNPVTSIPGEYILLVTNPLNGCKSIDTVTVQQENISPENVIATVQDTLTCTLTSVTLIGSSDTDGVTYNWSGPNGFNSTEQNPVVSNTGIYSLLVIDTGNGCTSSASVWVEQDTTYPSDVFATVSGILTCTDSIVTLTGSSNSGSVIYSWLDPNSSALTGNPITVSIPGTYILTVTKTVNGCSQSVNVTVDHNIEAPAGLTASVSDILSCTVPSVILSASSTTAGVTYRWEGPLGFVSDDQFTITSIPGNYTVTATDPVNGCTSVVYVVVVEEECQ